MSLEGRLEDLGLPDIFQVIGLSKRSGILTVIHREGTARIVFSEGNVVFVSSDKTSRFGYSLLQKGVISYEALEEALRIQKTTSTKKPLGTILLEMGIVSQESIEKLLKEHILDAVKDLLTWETGSFHFELGGVMEDEIVLRGGISSEYLLLEGARLRDEEVRVKTQDQDPSPEASEPVSTLFSEAGSESRAASSGVPLASRQRGRKDLDLLTAMIEELSNPSNSSEIILMILRFASELMNRAIIFIVREGEVAGLGQFGVILNNGSADQMIRNVRIPMTDPSCFRAVVEKGLTYRGAIEKNPRNEYLVQQLGANWPLEVLIVPVISDGKVIAVLYGDNVPHGQRIGDTEGLESFIKVAGFAFGKAVLQRKLQATQHRTQD
ncbi:MAG TPA: DUF4388 domain-containing protein [Nitrospiria bacterium]|nr:DUF4388 domain-containing protein [Nitrospiria bacterium]